MASKEIHDLDVRGSVRRFETWLRREGFAYIEETVQTYDARKGKMRTVPSGLARYRKTFQEGCEVIIEVKRTEAEVVFVLAEGEEVKRASCITYRDVDDYACMYGFDFGMLLAGFLEYSIKDCSGDDEESGEIGNDCCE